VIPEVGSDGAYETPTTPEPWERPFRRTGDDDLPYAVRLRGSVYRWHTRDWLFQGAEFHRTFEDGPWKWDAQGRFAGKGINCGHYFGLSVAAANEEAKHYGIDTSTSALIELEGKSRRILDLTHPDVIRAVFETCVDEHRVVSHSYYTMLEELIERDEGGSVITNYIGHWARRQGYEGILFFSARAMDFPRVQRMDRDLEAWTYRMVFRDLRKDSALLNVVMFSGATVLDKAKMYRIDSGPRIANPLHGKGADEIYELFEYDESYQLEREEFLLTRPRYVPGG
jgi:hypothetical protein